MLGWALRSLLGKPAVGRTECTEVWSYIKRLKSELKSILCPNKQFIFFNWSSMDMYTIKDFGSSHFNHDSQNSFSVYQDSQTTKMVDHSITKITFPPPSIQTINKRIVFKSQKSKHLSTTWIPELLAFVNPYCKSMDVFIWIAKARIPEIRTRSNCQLPS